MVPIVRGVKDDSLGRQWNAVFVDFKDFWPGFVFIIGDWFIVGEPRFRFNAEMRSAPERFCLACFLVLASSALILSHEPNMLDASRSS